jgi:hypothetical protein
MAVQMTDGFANAVAVSIPIFALAAGAEARTIRDRLKRTDERWDRQFAEYSAEHELDPGGSAQAVLDYFRKLPRPSALRTAERILAIGGAVVWLVVFILLTIAELMALAWLADGEPAGHGGLATFILWSIGLAMVTLIMAPTLYLAVPLVMPLDMVPAKLTKTVLPKLTTEKGRGFVRQLFSELEGAIDRAADQVESQAGKAEDAESAPHHDHGD